MTKSPIMDRCRTRPLSVIAGIQAASATSLSERTSWSARSYPHSCWPAAPRRSASRISDALFRRSLSPAFITWSFSTGRFWSRISRFWSCCPVYGLHRYEMIRGYWKHRKHLPETAPQQLCRTAARHHPASDLQRALTSSNACWRRRPRSIIPAPAADPGSGRFHRRHPSLHRAPGSRVSGSRAAHRIHPPDQSSRLQSRRAGERTEDRDRRNRRHFRRRFRSASRFPAAHRALTSPIRKSAWCRRAGRI